MKGELAVVPVVGAYALHSLAGSAPHEMSLMPRPHPDVAVLRFPDFGQLHSAPTAWTFERIVAKALFEALAPFRLLEALVTSLGVKV
jgi:hypothetical protein